MPSMPSTITLLSVAVPAGGPDWQQISAKGRIRPGSHAHGRRRPRIGLLDPAGTMVFLASPVSGPRRLGAPGRLLYTTRHDAGGQSA